MSHRRVRIAPEVVAWNRGLSLFEKIGLIVVFPFVLMLAAGCEREAPPSHVFHSGKIVTVDPQFRIVQAMAIRDGRVLAVGSNAEILRLADSGTERVDLAGKTVLPGLIDSHVHAPDASMYEFEQPVPDMQTIEDVLAYIRERAEKTEAGRWITMSQVFITRLREQRYPTRAELDRAAPRHPVTFRTGPDASLNSLALSMSGIDARFEVPEDSPAASSAMAKVSQPGSCGIVRATSVPTTVDRRRPVPIGSHG
jgi:predicted amidohydrolase YtcJ